MSSHRRRLVVAALPLVLALVTGSSAEAAWTRTGSGNAFGKSITMPGGITPSAGLSNRNVTVSWATSTLPDGTPVGSYVVKRYNILTGLAQIVGTNCSGTVQALTCAEIGVPAGSWTYSVAPKVGNWLGAESPRSGTVNVGAPTLALTPPLTYASLPGTLSGILTNFIAGQSVTFRLDDPVTGTPLSGTVTPASIPPTGTATVSVTVPKGVPDGTHTVFALGSQGDVAQATFDVNVPRPTPTLLRLVNVARAGRARPTDRIEVTFSHRLDVASMCSTWSNDLANQTITGNNVVSVTIANNAAAGNDELRVTTTAAACGGQFHLGTVNLGSPNFVTATTAFAGAAANQSTVSWDATAFRMVVTLGARASGPNPALVAVPTTAVFTPDPAILSSSGRAITGTVASTAVHF